MQNHVGLHNCSITRELGKCVSAYLGTLNDEERGPVEIWGNFSEQGLLSLREDLTHPEAAPTRTYQVGPGECCVTSRQTECVHAKVADIPEHRDGVPTGRIAQIWACLSLAGIDRLLKHLRETDVPIDLAPLQTARSETPYAWTVVHHDGDIQHQFPLDAPEQTFRAVRVEAISLLQVGPRNSNGELPIYRLHEWGFERLAHRCANERLPVPVPSEPFQFRYYRRVTVVVFGQFGAGQAQKPRIVQVLGWRIERPQGALICELGVEEDGSWRIYRRGRVRAGTADQVDAMTEEEFDAAMAA